jgi:hypothetical protein
MDVPDAAECDIYNAHFSLRVCTAFTPYDSAWTWADNKKNLAGTFKVFKRSLQLLTNGDGKCDVFDLYFTYLISFTWTKPLRFLSASLERRTFPERGSSSYNPSSRTSLYKCTETAYHAEYGYEYHYHSATWVVFIINYKTHKRDGTRCNAWPHCSFVVRFDWAVPKTIPSVVYGYHELYENI